MNGETIFDALQGLFGGALTTIIGATIGRLMYHSSEVKKQKRKFFGPELVWELPVVFGMAICGEGIASYLELEDNSVAFASIVTAAYLGPRGVEAMLTRWFKKA